MSEKIEFSDYTIEKIETMAGIGLNVVQMAAILGVSKRTFERRAREDERISDAIEKGRAVAAQNVTKTAYSLATSGKCAPMTMFWLKCRERWREVNAHEISGPNGRPIETLDRTSLTDEELDARIDEMILKRNRLKGGN